jgi:predicted transcriptional regulator YdeE
MDLTIISTIRTNNFNDDHLMQKITDMWKGASTELSEHKGNTYGVYYEYESDYKGDYTLSVAIEGESDPSITIAEDTKYEVFKVNTDSEQGIINTWSESGIKKKKVN